MRSIKHFAFIIAIASSLAACSDDDPMPVPAPGLEPVLVETVTVDAMGVKRGMKFEYDTKGQLVTAYDYYLNNSVVSSGYDTTSLVKYNFNRSSATLMEAERYSYNSATGAWNLENDTYKFYYNGSELTKYENYWVGGVNFTHEFEWDDTRLVKLIQNGGPGGNEYYYVGKNYKDTDPYNNSWGGVAGNYYESANTTQTTFLQTKNYIKQVPFEYVLVGQFSYLFNYSEYFSENNIHQIGNTDVTETYSPDKSTKLKTATNINNRDYTYVYDAGVSAIYPVKVTITNNSTSIIEDHATPSNSSSATSSSAYAEIDITYIKK